MEIFNGQIAAKDERQKDFQENVLEFSEVRFVSDRFIASSWVDSNHKRSSQHPLIYDLFFVITTFNDILERKYIILVNM